MTLETKPINDRGFLHAEFVDRYGAKCSIQESSLADAEGHIWLGCDEIGLKRFEPGLGWSDVPLKADHNGGVVYQANARMHLSQTMVHQLLPLLQYFAEHGELPGRERKE